MFLGMMESRLRCDGCGASAVGHGIENVPPEMRPFIRGEVVVNMRPLGICGNCYAVLCSACARNGRCSRCSSPFPLLAECPSTPPPWWQLAKRLKWRRVWNNQ